VRYDYIVYLLYGYQPDLYLDASNVTTGTWFVFSSLHKFCPYVISYDAMVRHGLRKHFTYMSTDALWARLPPEKIETLMSLAPDYRP